VRLIISANKDCIHEAVEHIHRSIPLARIAGRLVGSEIVPLSELNGLSHDYHNTNPSSQPVSSGDVVLEFSESSLANLNAKSGVFVVDSKAFLKAASIPAGSGKRYINYLHDYGIIEESAEAFFRDVAHPRDIRAKDRFVVNSFPKSGTIWLMTMIGKMLRVSTDRHIYLTHTADIEIATHSKNLLGSVGLVRDLRDVVWSWYHDVQRTDLQAGFHSPRYPNVSKFYFEYFLGKVYESPQFYSGNLEKWLNYLGARAIPIIRYEDLISQPEKQLQRLAHIWKFDVSETTVKQVVTATQLDTMEQNLSTNDTYISQRLKLGHVRSGTSGEWRTALPSEITNDIWQRFSGYMHRLRYHKETDEK